MTNKNTNNHKIKTHKNENKINKWNLLWIRCVIREKLIFEVFGSHQKFCHFKDFFGFCRSFKNSFLRKINWNFKFRFF